MFQRAPLIPLAALLLSAPASAGALSPWAGATGAQTFALCPYLYINPEGGADVIPYALVGLNDQIDLIAGAGWSFADGGASGPGLDAMIRAFDGDLGVVAHALYTPGEDAFYFGPELHYYKANSYGALTVNAGWLPGIGDAAYLGAPFVLFAPEVYLAPETFSVFLELNPSLALPDRAVDLTVVPGVSVALGIHSVAVGVVTPLLHMEDGETTVDASGWQVGAWYSVIFGGA
jgi:hypothetical protein